ncbi:myb-like protein D isoform X1 [Lucilia cuprina]|uniref:myb-like protein D isoform X1 n=1 Tax=Lucilia cuprina TaxID=7375 RepID=UPI001F05F27A|nr:myb-like protein D isoform X1 [Lucilia cuprina]XP_046802717.1 myb-like protein D isoform X1 [Lucilia cuprina]
MDQMTSSYPHTDAQNYRENNNFAETLRKRYLKATELLFKIKQNARYRKRPIYDKKDRERCEKTIMEYREYLRTQDRLKVAQARREKEAQQRQEHREFSYKEQSEIRKNRNELCMALVNEKQGNRQPVSASQWPMIETHISDILFKYLLHNKNGPIPRYDSGEIYRGYYLIQCKDEFSKEFLCNCMSQVKDVFNDLSLNVIEIDKIHYSNEYSHNSPSPSSVGEKSASSNGPIDERRRYITSLERLKFYAGLGQLTRNERKNLKRIKRFIRDYEERNGLPATPMDNIGNGQQQNEQGFQLSVNYGSLREQMEDFSQGSCERWSSSNQLPSDEQNSQSWGAWNSRQMLPESFPQRSDSSSFNNSNFVGEFPFNSANNYNTEMESNWRPDNTWNCTTQHSFSDTRENVQNNFEFRNEQRSNSFWNYEDSQANDYHGNRQEFDFNGRYNQYNRPEMRRNNQDVDFNERRNYDEESNQYDRPEMRRNNQDFDFNERRNYDEESNHYKRPEMKANSQGRESFMPVNNNYETVQSWRENQMANNAWQYEEPNETNYTSLKRQSMSSNFNQEYQNSSQQLNSFAASSSRNMMTNSSWNNTSPADRIQTNNEEEPSKMRLEKQVIELLNALGANKLPVASTQLQIPKESHNLGKRKSDLKATEVINLSDDSDHEEKVEKKAEMEYYKALAKLRKFESRANETLTEQEKFFKETSEFIVRQYETKFCSKPRQQTNNINNNQLQENLNESQNNKTTKWNSVTNNNYTEPQTTESSKQLISYPNPTLRKLTTNSNRSHVNNDTQLQIAIIDRNEPDLRLSKRLWTQLETELFKTLRYEVEKTNNKNLRQFNAKQWLNDFKIVKCENIQALDFIKRFINKQTLLNSRLKYDVIPVSELPKQAIVRVWIPPPNEDDMSLLRNLKEQNQALHSRSWTLKNSRERLHNNGKDLYIYISPLSVEKLSFCQGEIRYGNKRLKMELLDEQV